MRSFRNVVGATVATALLALSVGMATASAAQAGLANASTVKLRGTAWDFQTFDPIPGATVRVAELPDVVTTAGPDGSYEIEVPDGTRVTPYAGADGYYPIHLQTFVTAGRDLERVHLQIPQLGTYNLLAQFLGVQQDANGDLVNCGIVSTVSTEQVRDLSFDDYSSFGAHGVAGATAAIEPPAVSPIYFKPISGSFPIPDPSLTESTIDGGVLWTEVPEGRYRVSAQHPTTRFADFVADCQPGRLVNANPPQGLYELRAGEEVDTAVAAQVASVKAKRRGKRRIVKLRTTADEYVSVAATVVRRGKELAAADSGKEVGGYAPGPRKLKLKLPRKPKRGKLKVTTTFADAAGNELTQSEKVRLPKPKAKRRR